jgi:CRISPR/Cas system-associated exonuclease Cas4 (RecB family)
MDPRELVIDVLRKKDATRSRSSQKQVGPSELGGCRRKVWYRLNDQPETNDNELKLAAIMGTAIHASIEEALALEDPSGEKYVVEQVVEFGDMKAHIDLWIPESGAVVDWKTVKKNNLSYFPSIQQRWQVQVYGYLLEKSGKGKPKTVNLVAIARDGNENDVQIHTEDYDPAIAEEALNWLAAIKESTEVPEPEKSASYCQHYCKYYDASGEMGCVGIKKGLVKGEELPPIDNPDVDALSITYLQLEEKLKTLTIQKDAIKSALEGFTGVTNYGVEIKWSTVSGGTRVDTEEVERLLGFVPKKQGQESIRLSVKQKGDK